jgi:hypothetical protein
MAKVVYLFGAGASAQRLPVIASMTSRIKDQVEWIDKNAGDVNDSDKHQQIGQTSRALLFEYRDALKKLPEEVAPYATIDLYARWLETNRDYPKLDRFKATVITFFAIEQYIHGFDPRYEGFFGSILDHRNRKLPDDVVILTWNYDQHMAMALARAGEHSDLAEVMGQHGIRTLYRLTRGQSTDFRILHLNGIAGFNARATDRPMHDYINGRDRGWGTPLDNMAYFFGMLYHDRFSSGEGQMLLSYSWEALADNKTPWEKVTAALVDTEELVVVGYSFPDFNRVVDLKLIAAMQGLKRVVIQSPQSSIEGLLTKLTMIAPELESKLIPYPLIHEFYVPNRLLVR